ncbi:MAG TPA: hypothetical protein VJV22_21550 [Acidobacteriaceae bacterium]|nr:hypothetical protein [Acidobacteriaceae bacterium]
MSTTAELPAHATLFESKIVQMTQGVILHHALCTAARLGIAMGAEIDIVGFLMSRYFGLRSLGTCVAVGFGGFILAGGIGVFLMGAGFDATGSYALPLAGFFTAMVVAALLMTGLGPYRFAVMAVHESEPLKAGAA